MKKNKLYALLMIAFVMIVPMNYAFLSLEDHTGAMSLFMMAIFEILVLVALIIGINDDTADGGH